LSVRLRDSEGLREALEQLKRWKSTGTSVEDRETANLLALARVMTAAALAREESRGAHYRKDFPATSPSFQHQIILNSPVTIPC